jgi:hypothetical protein
MLFAVVAGDGQNDFAGAERGQAAGVAFALADGRDDDGGRSGGE